jgi:hypothetical protein
MNKKFFVLILIYVALAMQRSAFAATVPAGTTLVVRTNVPISTHAKPGNHFTATLDKSVGGLPAGTPVTGLIQTSRGSRSTTSSSPLTLVLTAVSANGKTISIRTNSVQPQPPHTTRAKRGSFSFGEDTFPLGTKLEFRLSQPANL